MEIKRPYKRCNEEKKEMAVSIPTSTINQVTMLVIFFIRLVVQFIIIITLSTSFMFHVCRLHHLIILISNVNRTLPSSTISCIPIVYIAIIITFITTFITTIILLIVTSPAWSWRHHPERCQLQSKSKWGRLVRSTS